MKNQYLEKLSKIEFVVTDACTGQCKHCSQGDHKPCGERIDADIAVNALRSVASEYDLKTVMTFGGEPMLCADTVCEIMRTASELGIAKRQVITNGYFSKSAKRVSEVAAKLSECGVNDLLLSVDAFHQESIPIESVRAFAVELKRYGVPTRLQPAWLVSAADTNPYNMRTRELLDSLADLNIPESEGNVIFPEGNALKYLSDYFKGTHPQNPYEEDPKDVRCLSFSANGDVLDGNVYREDIMDIIKKYTP